MDAIVTASPAASDDELLTQAADWLVTLTSGKAMATDAAELASWREQDPRHDAAFRQVARLSGLTRELIDNPPRRVSRRAVLAGGVAVTAGIGAVGIAQPPLGLWPSLGEMLADHRTVVGQRYAFTPVAGVSVEMNSKTSVSLAERGRAIELINGEAYLHVRDSTQPFEVRAGGIKASATNAAFNVQALQKDISVTCLEGDVRCVSGSAAIVVRANEQLVIASDGRPTRRRVNAATATAWRDGILVFEGTPLRDVVRQINTYRSGDIVLTNNAIGHRPVSAVLHTGQIENAVSQIQQLLGLQVRRLPGGIVLMS